MSGDIQKKDSLAAASFTKKDICNIVFHTQQVCFFGRACPGLWLLPCFVSNNNMPKIIFFCRFLMVLFVLLLNKKQAGSTRSQLPAPLCTARGTSCTQCTLWTHERLSVFCISATKKGIRIPIYPPAESTPVVQKVHSVQDKIVTPGAAAHSVSGMAHRHGELFVGLYVPAPQPLGMTNLLSGLVTDADVFSEYFQNPQSYCPPPVYD